MVLRTAQTLVEVSEELVDCAKGLSAAATSSKTAEEDEEYQVLVEKAEILRRDWSAKV